MYSFHGNINEGNISLFLMLGSLEERKSWTKFKVISMLLNTVSEGTGGLIVKLVVNVDINIKISMTWKWLRQNRTPAASGFRFPPVVFIYFYLCSRGFPWNLPGNINSVLSLCVFMILCKCTSLTQPGSRCLLCIRKAHKIRGLSPVSPHTVIHVHRRVRTPLRVVFIFGNCR